MFAKWFLILKENYQIQTIFRSIFRIKKIAEKNGLQVDDLLLYLEMGPPFDRGFKSLIQKHYDEAALLFQKNAESSEYSAANSWFFLAKALFGKGQYDKAIEALKKTLSLRPSGCMAWSYWGSILAKMRKFDEAIIRHRKAIELNPESWEIYTNFANTLNSAGRYPEALEILTRLRRCNLIGLEFISLWVLCLRIWAELAKQEPIIKKPLNLIQ